MDKRNDDKLEEFFFKDILGSNDINVEILNIIDLILAQKISNDDKNKLINHMFGGGIANSKDELDKMYSDLGYKGFKEFVVYKLILELIESIFEVDNQEGVFLVSRKDEINSRLLNLFKIILKGIWDELKNSLYNKKSFFEILNKDYLSDNELSLVLEEIDNIVKESLVKSKEIIEYKETIKTIESILKQKIK